MIHASEIEIVRKRLYANDVHFKGFQHIDEETLKKIKDLVKKEKKQFISNSSFPSLISNRMTEYIAVMRYLGSTLTNQNLPTYDEKIVFLIEALDPNLEMYKYYLSLPIILKSQIVAEENEIKKLTLMHSFDNQVGMFESKIRLKMGFFDQKLLNYEAKYFKKIKCHDELITDVKQAYFIKLNTLFNGIKDFNGITKKENDNLIIKAIEYEEKYGHPDANTLAYQLIYQADLLQLNNMKERVIFFILLIDKDLKLLDIYNNSSTWDDIKAKSLEEFGFYNKDLITLEKRYQEMFVPNFNPWELKKEI